VIIGYGERKAQETQNYTSTAHQEWPSDEWTVVCCPTSTASTTHPYYHPPPLMHLNPEGALSIPAAPHILSELIGLGPQALARVAQLEAVKLSPPKAIRDAD
jgi:hypothetical protein